MRFFILVSASSLGLLSTYGSFSSMARHWFRQSTFRFMFLCSRCLSSALVSSAVDGSYIGSWGYSNSSFSGLGLSSLSTSMLSFATIANFARPTYRLRQKVVIHSQLLRDEGATTQYLSALSTVKRKDNDNAMISQYIAYCRSNNA